MVGISASGGPEPAPRRSGRASSVTATVLAVLALVLTAAALVLSVLVRQLSVLGSGPIIPVVVVYAAAGFVVARRQPGNPIGWILSGFIVVILLFPDGRLAAQRWRWVLRAYAVAGALASEAVFPRRSPPWPVMTSASTPSAT
jgi:hypothetical protein